MARPFIENLSGRKLGRLTVIRYIAKGRWLCRCDCGAEKLVPGSNLRSGAARSCGCLRRELTSQRKTKHGKNKKGQRSRVYSIWNGMRQRCHNPNQPHYVRYGGRGIAVCDRWRESFESFYADMGEPPTDEHSIDRIDNARGYEPGNCRWATHTEQARNKRAA